MLTETWTALAIAHHDALAHCSEKARIGVRHNIMWEKSFPITFHQMKIVHSITKDDKTWKKVLYNHSLSNLPIAQNKIKFMKKMHQSNFVNWRGTVKSNLSVIKSLTIVKLFLKSNPIFGNKRNKKLGLFHIWPHCEYFFYSTC